MTITSFRVIVYMSICTIRKGGPMSRAPIKRHCRRLDKEKRYKSPDRLGAKDPALVIGLDEFEAMRLCDHEMLSQVEASGEMRVSRATLQRLLAAGRHKIVEAVLLGRSIVVSNEITNIQLRGENKMDKKEQGSLRIALPTTDKETVDEHFGHCKYFALYDMEGSQVMAKTIVEAPAHAPGVLPKFLGDQKADVIITGGMGQMAVGLFKEQNIDVILGARGKIEDNLEEYVGGSLSSTGTPCDH